VGFTAQLAHRFDHLDYPATIAGMIVAKTATVGVAG
jgi:hypothetical protein